MEGQIDIFEYLSTKDIDFIPYLAQQLRNHCREWRYDWLEKLEVNKTSDNFLKLFCNVSKTYYFQIDNGDYFGATFNKADKTLFIYKCGRDYTGKALYQCDIEELLLKL